MRKCMLSEEIEDRDIGRIASARNVDAADVRDILACIKRLPVIPKVNLEPSTEVARREIDWHTGIPEIPGAVPRRDIHAAARRDGKMGVVAAHADAFVKGLGRAAG